MKRSTRILIAAIAVVLAGLLALKARASLTANQSVSANTTTTTLTVTGTITAGSGPTTLTTSVGAVAGGALANPSTVANFYRSYHSGSSSGVVSNSAANFFPFDGTETPVASTLEGNVSTTAPLVSTIKNMQCSLYTAAGVLTVAGGTNYVVALRQNIATSTLTCTIAAGASSCSDLTHTVTTAILDQLDYIDTPSGTPTALVVKCSVEVDI